MDSQLLQSLEDIKSRSGNRTKDAVTWFQDKIDVMRGRGPDSKVSSRFPKDTEKTFLSTRMNVRTVGRMLMYAYDPKTKNRLPYYDILPLILVVDVDARGFHGLNLHYVPPLLRKTILDNLRKNLNDGPIPQGAVSPREKKGLLINYNLLRKSVQFPVLKQCFKRYLFSHVRSSFMYIAPSEWDRSVMLPTERFVKAPKSKVFRDSLVNAAMNPVVKPKATTKPGSTPDVRTTDFFRGKAG